MPTIPMPQFPSAQSGRSARRSSDTKYASTGGHELAQGLSQARAAASPTWRTRPTTSHYARGRSRSGSTRNLTKFNHGITSELYGAPEAIEDRARRVSGAWGLDVSAPTAAAARRWPSPTAT
jgi:hypothetical protein